VLIVILRDMERWKDTYDNDGNAHELEKSATLLIVFSGDLDGPTREPVHVLDSARLFCLFPFLLCLFASLETLSELHGDVSRGSILKGTRTYNTLLEFWGFPIKDVSRLYAVLDDADGAIEEAHEVAGRLSGVVCEHLAVLLPNGDEELVDGHGRVDGDLAAKEGLDVVLLDGIGRVFEEEGGETLDAHGGGEVGHVMLLTLSSSSMALKFVFPALVVLYFLLWSSAELSQSSLRLVAPNSDVQCRPIAFPVPDQCLHVADDCPDPDTVLSINYLQRYFCTPPHLRPLAFSALVLWLFFLFSTLGITASDFFTPNLATIAQLLGLDENVAGVTFLAFGNGSPDVFSTFSAMRAGSGSLAIGELLGAATFIVSCVVGAMCIIKPFKVHRGPFLRDVGFFAVAVSVLLVILEDGQIRAWEAGLLVALYLVYVIFVIVGSWWERRQEWKRHREALIRAEYQEEDPIHEHYRDNGEHSSISPLTQRTIDGSINLSLSQEQSQSTSASPPRLRLQTNLPQHPIHDTSSPTRSVYHAPQIPSFSLVGALEFRKVVASLQQRASSSSLSIFESPGTPFAGGRYYAYPVPHERTSHVSLPTHEEDPWDTALGLQRLQSPISTPPSTEEPQQQIPRRPPPAPSDSLPPSQLTLPSLLRAPTSPDDTEDSESQTYVFPLTRRQRALSVLGHTAYVLFPSLHHFRARGPFGKLMAIFATPAVLLLTLTLPVVVTPYVSDGMAEKTKNTGLDAQLVDFEEEGVERVLIAEEEVLDDMHEMAFNKWLVAVQCALAPLFSVAVLARVSSPLSCFYLSSAKISF